MYMPKYLMYIRHSIMHNKIEKHISIRFKKNSPILEDILLIYNILQRKLNLKVGTSN